MSNHTDNDTVIAEGWVSALSPARLAEELDKMASDTRYHRPEFRAALVREAANRVQWLDHLLKGITELHTACVEYHQASADRKHLGEYGIRVEQAALKLFPNISVTSRGRKNKAYFDMLEARDRCCLRRLYRDLRIRVPYGSPGSSDLDGYRKEGHSVGKSREQAKNYVRQVAMDWDWALYLATK